MPSVTVLGKEIPYAVEYRRMKTMRLLYQAGEDPAFLVRCARYVPMYEIEKFVRSNVGWMAKQLEKSKEEEFTLMGKKYQLELNTGEKNRVELYSNRVVITQRDTSQGEITDKLIYGLWQALLEDYLEKNRVRYEEITGTKGVRFTFRAMTSLWGSCTYEKKKINLNLHLARFSPKCIDSIVFHEYAHFHVHNHSKAFYDVLKDYCPDWKKSQKELKGVSFSKPSHCVKMNVLKR